MPAEDGGKTTTISMIAGLLECEGGVVSWRPTLPYC
jgi:ABC-type sugar transport system ATPase subunit